MDVGQCLVSFRGIGRILDRNVERLVEFWIDIDRLEEFGRILVSLRVIEKILDRYVERLVEFWKD